MAKLLFLSLVFLVPVVPRNPEKAAMPTGAQPTFGIVSQIVPDQGEILVQQITQVNVPVNVQKQVLVNGQVRIVIETVIRQETRVVLRKISLKNGGISTAGGKKLSEKEALQQVKVGATVVLGRGPVDPLYLRVFQPDTLVVVLPPETAIPVGPGRPGPKVLPPIKR